MIVYKLTNTVNGKVYIGITKRGLEWRFRRHVMDARRFGRYAIHRALMKYGPENFSREVIAEADEFEEIKVLEVRYVAEYRSFESQHGYNMTVGGDGAMGLKHSQEAKDKMSRVRKGRVITPEWRANLSASTKGRPKSEESNGKRSLALRGLAKSPEHRSRLSEALVGRPRPDLIGEQHGCSKLSDVDRVEIYRLRIRGIPRVEVASRYRISVNHIWNVVQYVLKHGLVPRINRTQSSEQQYFRFE